MLLLGISASSKGVQVVVFMGSMAYELPFTLEGCPAIFCSFKVYLKSARWLLLNVLVFLCCPEIDELQKQRKQLLDRFRSEQLAYNEQLKQQSEEDRLRRDQQKAAWEAKRRYR